MPRGAETIAAVVAFAAKNNDGPALEIRESGLDEFGDTVAGAFHEREAGHTILFCREPINFAHFSGGEYFHLIPASREAARRISIMRVREAPSGNTQNKRRGA